MATPVHLPIPPTLHVSCIQATAGIRHSQYGHYHRHRQYLDVTANPCPSCSDIVFFSACHPDACIAFPGNMVSERRVLTRGGALRQSPNLWSPTAERAVVMLTSSMLGKLGLVIKNILSMLFVCGRCYWEESALLPICVPIQAFSLHAIHLKL